MSNPGPARDDAPFHAIDASVPVPDRTEWRKAADGVRLRVAHLAAQGPDAGRGTVLLFSGRTEYLEKYAYVMRDLALTGLDVAAIDWRGQGLSDRTGTHPRAGHIEDFAHYQRDVAVLVAYAQERGLPRPWHVLSHSMGGAIALAALHDGLDVATASFSAPMFGINLAGAPTRFVMGLGRAAEFARMGQQPAIGTGGEGTYIADNAFSRNVLTPDPENWSRLLRESVQFPQLTLGGATYGWVRAALAECNRLKALPALDLPALVSIGSQERVVSMSAIRARCGAWPSAQLLEIGGAEHEVLMDVPERRAQFFDAMLALIARTG